MQLWLVTLYPQGWSRIPQSQWDGQENRGLLPSGFFLEIPFIDPVICWNVCAVWSPVWPALQRKPGHEYLIVR